MLAPITFILLSSVVTFGTPCCEQKERKSTFLDAAVDLILKAKSENITCATECNSTLGNPQDCADIYRNGYNESGVYHIYPINRLTFNKRIPVYCDMTTDGGGWTIIQRRGDFGREDEYFNQNWKSYQDGFGDLRRDFWFGNDNIFAMTNQKPYSVRFDIEDKHQNRVYAHYDTFWIDNEFNKYTLHIAGYRGTAGNSMIYHNTMKFSTKDRDNDANASRNCAVEYKSGWWFSGCYFANLNGRYNVSTHGINWWNWKKFESLGRAVIKIRPSTF